MGDTITTDHGESTAKFRQKPSADCAPSSKREPTKKRKPRASAKLNAAPKKKNLRPKSKSSSPSSRNLPPSAYMRPVITGINANGEGGAVEWVNVGIKPTQTQTNGPIEAAPIQTMAETIERRMLIVISQRDPKIMAQYKAQMDDIRRELGAGADHLEALLVERVVLCWARLQFVEDQTTCAYVANSTWAAAERWDDRLTHAHARFLRACAALARVRKLQKRPRGMGASAAAALLKNLTAGDWSASDGLRTALAGRKSE
jgi:hypothetical protein